MVSLVGGSKDVVRIEYGVLESYVGNLSNISIVKSSLGIPWAWVGGSALFAINANDARMLESLMVMASKKGPAEFPA